ncbi:MAG TPA: hypothetical protein VJ783_05615 [Pirellulales bacterium]|nr:hypothetical protein [Pirellulales bacterium]
MPGGSRVDITAAGHKGRGYQPGGSRILVERNSFRFLVVARRASFAGLQGSIISAAQLLRRACDELERQKMEGKKWLFRRI